MIKLLTVIGARPQIIKAAAVSRAINKEFSDRIIEEILHTGQHYDERMSEVFFLELGIPRPNHQLNVGSLSHGEQTAAMVTGVEEILKNDSFDALLVYGDTNSTLAGALAAAKLHVPVIHVEAGLRSFNKSMPEEINRICCDHCSTLLFSPTLTGIENLAHEGFDVQAHAPYTLDNPGIFHCGDVMYDNSLHFAAIAQANGRPSFMPESHDDFVLVTIHRPYNTDDAVRLFAILDDLRWMALERGMQIIFPMHPRTRSKLMTVDPERYQRFDMTAGILVVEPVGFLEMTWLESQAKMIVTDSGGVQKEAFFFRKPSVVIRSETEWVELIEHGSARLSFETGEKMREHFDHALSMGFGDFPPIFGDGNAARFICSKICETF